MDRVVLAYSGGLDTSVAALTLREERGLDVVAALVDLGQPIDRAEVQTRAAAAGAELRVIDAKDRFAEEFCLPALFANALYEGKYPLVSALARPLIAEEVVSVAREVGARFVAHGCTGKGNDQVRFETSFAALAPDLSVIAPVRERAMSRDEAQARAQASGIPISFESKVYSVDENLWGRTVECGPLEDPWTEPPPEAFALTADARSAPDDPREVAIGFERGRPISLDGESLSLRDLIVRLTKIGAEHGFGRVDMVENRLVGIKSREVYEVPAALALILAHRDLEDLTLERELGHEKSGAERRWAELCYYGQWHGPLLGALRSFMEGTQERVSGEVRLRLFRGSCTVTGRRSTRALYDHALATYDQAADRFDHRQAEGFVSLWSLPVRVWAERGRDDRREPAPATEPAPHGSLAEDADEPRRAWRGQGGAAMSAASSSGEKRFVWAERFASGPAEEAMAFTRSTADRRLILQDLQATRAHANALHRAGLLDTGGRDRLVAQLDDLIEKARAGGFPFRDTDEDVHVAVERVLTERLGELGARIHAGRSRNDLVVTDLRLWTKDAANELAELTRALAKVLADRAEQHVTDLLPGYTHLQRGQPVSLAQHLLAHAFPFARDAQRLDRAAGSADRSALGAGAIAGSTLPLDPDETAADLGMGGAFENSIDAVSDRDFALDFLAASLSVAIHLSRLAEDLVLWSSEEFGFARPADAHATGSSMMPQKRNPDVAELARAQAGRVLGDLVTLATVLKGLPLAYDRDLQEDKPPMFDAYDSIAPALDAMAGMIATIEFDTDRMREACTDGFLLATDLAEGLVASGIPFRGAHERVAGIVRTLEAEGRAFADLKPDEWAELVPELTPEAIGTLAREASLERRATPGGPSPKSVRAQIALLRQRISR